jgi:PAP2 superfamily
MPQHLNSRRPVGGVSRPRAWPPAVLLAALALVVWAGISYGPGRSLDAKLLGALREQTDLRWHAFASDLTHLADARHAALLTAGLAACALALHSRGTVIGIVAVLTGASVTTQLLQSVATDPRTYVISGGVQVSQAPSPSGHATFAAALALSATFVAPRAVRPFVAGLGAAFAVAISLATLVLGTHFPSDVIAGWLVAGAWATGAHSAGRRLGAGAPVSALGIRRPRHTAAALGFVVGLTALGTVAIGIHQSPRAVGIDAASLAKFMTPVVAAAVVVGTGTHMLDRSRGSAARTSAGRRRQPHRR